MPFTDEEIKQLGLEQLTPTEFIDARSAIDGFEGLFGQVWINDFFKGLKSKVFLLQLSKVWQAWNSISNLTNKDQIQSRWRQGFTKAGVIQEVLIFSRLLEKGADLELFPIINNKVPDGRLRLNNGNWIYIEVSARNLSDDMDWSNKVLQKLSHAASIAAPGRHGKIGVRNPITLENLDELLDWLQGQEGGKASYKELAVFHSTDISTGGADPTDSSVQFVAEPRVFTTYLHTENGKVINKGTAVIATPDSGAERILEDEAGQLPKHESGVVILDISRVTGGVKEWKPLIKARLNPNVNKRIAAVVLLSFRSGLQFIYKRGGEVILNPHARKPLQQDVINLLQDLVQ